MDVITMAFTAVLGLMLVMANAMAGLGFIDKSEVTFAAQACAIAEAKNPGSGTAIAQSDGAETVNVSVDGNVVTCSTSVSPSLPLIGPIVLSAQASEIVQ